MVKVLLAKLKDDAVIPSKRPGDGCYDVYACFDGVETIMPHEVKLIPTGICSAFDEGYRIAFRERGSNTKGTLIVMAGQIDSNYRGEWFVALYNGNDLPVVISRDVQKVIRCKDEIRVPYSKAIAQFALEMVPEAELETVSAEDIKSLKTERGEGCLGSSNK